MSHIQIGDEVTIGSWGYSWTVTGLKLSVASGGTKATLARESATPFPAGGFVGSFDSRAVIRTRASLDILRKVERK